MYYVLFTKKPKKIPHMAGIEAMDPKSYQWEHLG